MATTGRALSAAQLGEVLAELRPLVLGWRVKEAAAIPPHGVLLVLQQDGDTRVRRVLVCADPDAPRVHLVQGRLERHKGSVGPFYAQTSKALEGALVTRIEQLRSDRIALIGFDPASSPPRAALIAELTGRHSNLILVDGSERVVGLLVEAPKKPGIPPRLAQGSPWVPPPGHASQSGPSLSETLPEPPPPPHGTILAPLSWRVENVLGRAASDMERERAARDLGKRLERRLGKARGLVLGLAARAEAACGAQRWRQDGELMKSSLHAIARGAAFVEVADWFEGGATRRIELDPKLGPVENLERLFERAKKLERSKHALEREQRLANDKVQKLAALVNALADADADPAAIEANAVAAGVLDALAQTRGKRVQIAAPRVCYKRFEATSGADILVGRTARDNDELTFRVARGNDLWLHTADSPGSHIVLRLERGAEPHPEDVLDAAHLALYFSPLRGASRASIHIAPRKLVHKPKGAPAGLVTLSGGRSQALRVEPARLERLLAGERARTDPADGA